MHDLDIVISTAWSRIAPTLLADPAELARRLARRQGKCFTRPLRDHCHGVVHLCRVNIRHHWNQLILRLSGGLLFGHEVEIPDWLTEQPKRAKRRPNLRPRHPFRNAQLEKLLTETDLTHAQIAARLSMTRENVSQHARLIYKRHNVQSRSELKSLLRPESPNLSSAG